MLNRLSLPGLTRQSILFARRWMRGSSPIGANLSCLASSSCAGLTRASILFARKFLRRSMDCRVKPGNDDLKLARMGLDPRIHLLREKVLTKIDGFPGQT